MTGRQPHEPKQLVNAAAFFEGKKIKLYLLLIIVKIV